MGRGGFGGGGGGRSFGRGGGRSFSGRSGSFSSGRGGGSFGGSGFNPKSSRSGMGLGSSGGFWFSRPGHTHYTGGRVYSRGMGCGTASILFVIIAIIIVFVLASSAGDFGGGEITRSTVVREPLPKGSVNETGYYTDELNWIQNETEFLSGLKHFYQKTGVQPYVYITGDVGTSGMPSMSDIERFGNEKYDALFTDEAHLLLVFYENYGGYMTGCVGGVQTKTVIDQEARDILLDYLDRNYYSNMTEDEFFSVSFHDAAERIMTITTSPWIPVLIVLGILLIIVILFVWWKQRKKQKNLEAKQTEEMLKTPLEKFGEEDEAERLARNYDGDPDNDV